MSADDSSAVTLRFLSGDRTIQADLLSEDADEVTLRPRESDSPLPDGFDVVVSDSSGDHYARIVGRESGTLRVRKMWADRREYFRIDALLPISLRKADRDPSFLRTRMIAGYQSGPLDEEAADETISPRLWRLLVDINVKLEAIFETLRLQEEGFAKMEDHRVNLSATGLRMLSADRFGVNDVVEIRMLLPSYPPAGIVAYGVVVRTAAADDGGFETALHFINMEDDIREEIIRYTLQREREMIRQQRRQRGTND